MIRIDTLKLEIPQEAVRGINSLAFRRSDISDLQSGQIETFYKAKNDFLPVGCSEVKCKEGGEYQVRISAKTLGQKYLEGINTNTIEQALSSISDVIDIDTQKLIDYNPKVYLFDVTDNISLESLGGSKRDVINSLMAVKSNDRFLPYIYDSKHQLAVEFRGTQQEKNRLICYDKYLDLKRSKNKEFRESLPNPVLMFTQAQNTIRIESNTTTLKSARDRLSIPDNNLVTILNSKEAVNYNCLKKIMNHRKGQQLDIFDEYKKMNIQGVDYIRMKGIQSIITECRNDSKLIKEFFKFILGDRFNYYFYKSSVPIKKLIQESKMMNSKTDESKILTIADRLLDELLKVA
jgi:hypothetical protein